MEDPMHSSTWTRFALFTAFVVAGCSSSAPTDDRLHFYDARLPGAQARLRFSVNGCDLVDCHAGPRFAVGDPELIIGVHDGAGADCMPSDWSVQVVKTAVA